MDYGQEFDDFVSAYREWSARFAKATDESKEKPFFMRFLVRAKFNRKSNHPLNSCCYLNDFQKGAIIHGAKVRDVESLLDKIILGENPSSDSSVEKARSEKQELEEQYKDHRRRYVESMPAIFSSIC